MELKRKALRFKGTLNNRKQGIVFEVDGNVFNFLEAKFPVTILIETKSLRII